MRKRSPVTDTSRLPPELLLVDMLAGGGSSGAIERMEAEGQRELVRANGTVLPIEGAGDPAFKKMGILFGEAVDDLFIAATLPKGWSVKGSDHSMWTYLVDDKGRERASIFYKAAFYDRNAHMRPKVRYCARVEHKAQVRRDEPLPADYVRGVVEDQATGKIIFTSFPFGGAKYETERYRASGDAQREAEKWLRKHHPDYENAAAYWD